MQRPPKFPSENYLLENEKKSNILINKEEYAKKVEQGLLIENKICEAFLIQKPKMEIKEKKNSYKLENNLSLREKTEKIEEKNVFVKSKTENVWNFEFLTIEDENPKIKLAKYVDELTSKYHTKNYLDIMKLNKKPKKF